MNLLTQHTNIAIKLHKNKINLDFIKKYPIKDIMDCCYRIEEKNTKNEQYENNLLFQEELIRDKEFIRYLDIAYKRDYDIKKFKILLEQIRNHNKKMSDYPIKDIFRIVDNKSLVNEAMYNFLKFYIKENFKIRKTVIKNLNYFYSQNSIRFGKLTDGEKEIIKYQLLDNYNLIPKDNIKEVYAFLNENKELRRVIDFLYCEKLFIPLNIENYKEINMNATGILQYLKQITQLINNNEITYMMLLRWKDNNCNLYDLKYIIENIDKIEKNKLESIFNNKTSYINFIYGNKLKKFPMNELYGEREELIIYSIRENKNSFLKLIENNLEMFFSIPINSILFNKNLYTKYLNLNEITKKSIEKFKNFEKVYNSKLTILKEQNYTIEEIATLYKVSENYILLYNELLELRVDERLLIIKQLIKKDLLENIIDKNNIVKLAEKLKFKPLYLWMEKDYKHINGISINDVIQILINSENIEKFIPQVKDAYELAYLLRNCEKITKYDSLNNIKNDIQNIDEYWIKLKQELGFSEVFLQKYKNNIQQFLLKNGSELAYTYYNTRSNEQKQAFKLIIKSELMGEFKNLKYHTDDLKKEIDFNLLDYQIKEWTKHNSIIESGKYNVGEYDDFFNTMRLGEQPKTTCLSYKQGRYNACLLACFDSNKKILYAKINGKIVARAMVRLTKGVYNRNNKNSQSLSFIDVETGIQTYNDNYKERLTLFLERPYIAGITDNEVHEVKKLFIQLLKEKARKMNALLVLSNYYREEIDEQFISTEYYMYISKSKSSAQYLDSLSGQATISDEGQYKSNLFLVLR